MVLFNSNTFATESNIVITTIYGSQHILEVHHSEQNEIHQVSKFDFSEWNSNGKKHHTIATVTSFIVLPKVLAKNGIESTYDSVLNIENGLQKSTLPNVAVLFDGTNSDSPNQTILSQEHLASYAIDKTHKYAKQETNTLLICIWDNSILLCLYKGDKLLNCNRFECSDSTEAIYYCMLFVQEYDLDPETLNCQLFGNINTDGSFDSELKQYIRNVNINRKGVLPQADVDGILSLIFA